MNGRLSMAEITAALSSWGFFEEEIDACVTNFDGEGTIFAAANGLHGEEIDRRSFIETISSSDGMGGNIFFRHVQKIIGVAEARGITGREEVARLVRVAPSPNRGLFQPESQHSLLLLHSVATHSNMNPDNIRILAKQFREHSLDRKFIDFPAFSRIWRTTICPPGGAVQVGVERKVFDTFDRNHDGRLDIQEFARGMAKVCGDSLEERIQLLFDAYDANGDGITHEELEELLVSAMRDVDAAKQLGHEAMSLLDANSDGRVTSEELLGNRAMTALVSASFARPAAPVQADTDLRHLFAGDTLRVFYEEAMRMREEEGDAVAPFCVGLEQFAALLKQTLAIDDAEMAAALFRCFDSNEDSRVSLDELVHGISEWACGSQQEHLKFLFRILDEDGSGSIRMQELMRFISLSASEVGCPKWSKGLLEDASGDVGGSNGKDFTARVEVQRRSKARRLMQQLDCSQGKCGTGRTYDGRVKFEEFKEVLAANPALARTLMPSIDAERLVAQLSQREQDAARTASR
jgi:Ca2+-binding EF-hand superfamily protein